MLALAIVFAFVQTFFVGLTSDTDLMLYFTRHLFHGGGLYNRWLNLNSPIIVPLYWLPAAAVELLHLPPAMALHGYVALLCGASLIIANKALDGRIGSDQKQLWLAAAMSILLLLPYATTTYADRDHLFFIFALPWMLQMLLRLKPTTYSTLFAAFGFFIRPFYIFIFLALTVFGGPRNLPFHKRWFSASTCMMAGCFLGYIVWALTFFPQFFTVIFPVASITYYAECMNIYLRPLTIAIFISLELPLLYGMRFSRQELGWYCFIVASIIVYAFSGGWLYTLYLLTVPLTLTCFASLGKGRDKDGEPSRSSCYAVSGLLCILLALNTWAISDAAYRTHKEGHVFAHNYIVPSMRKALLDMGESNYILLSTSFWNIDLAETEGDKHSVSPYDDYFWMLPWLYSHTDDKNFPFAFRNGFAVPLLRAVKENPSTALIVYTSPGQWHLPPQADIINFMRSDDELRDMLSHYRRTKTLNFCFAETGNACRFDIWEPVTPQ